MIKCTLCVAQHGWAGTPDDQELIVVNGTARCAAHDLPTRAEGLLTAAEACARLGVSRRTFAAWARRAGVRPADYTQGHTGRPARLYRAADVAGLRPLSTKE